MMLLHGLLALVSASKNWHVRWATNQIATFENMVHDTGSRLVYSRPVRSSFRPPKRGNCGLQPVQWLPKIGRTATKPMRLENWWQLVATGSDWFSTIILSNYYILHNYIYIYSHSMLWLCRRVIMVGLHWLCSEGGSIMLKKKRKDLLTRICSEGGPVVCRRLVTQGLELKLKS